MLSQDIKTAIDESVLCWLATADEDGKPNCSPKEVFSYYDDKTLIIANIASPQSVKNILHNPKVCVSFVHIFKQKGFKLKGQASYVLPKDKRYTQLFKIIKPLAVGFPVLGIIEIQITSTNPILAPSYTMVKGTTEAIQITTAKKRYQMN